MSGIPIFRSESRANLKLAEAISALRAYDEGATDAGIHDPKLKSEVRDYLKSLSGEEFRIVMALFGQDMLSDDNIAMGYGMADVLAFCRWLEEELGIYV